MDTSVSNDPSLLYGEVSASPLQTFQTLLTDVYLPAILQTNEWKQNLSEEQRCDFQVELDKFVKRLRYGLVNTVDGFELQLPPMMDSIEISTSEIIEGKSKHIPDFIALSSGILENWCHKIELLLSNSNDEHVCKTAYRYDEGPKGEIDYWYDRMQHLSIIIEQSKRIECQKVIAAILSAMKGPGDQGASKLSHLLRRWKQCETDATDALIEARDNVKYLQTLERFIEPLRFGSIQSLIDLLPALINSIKVCREPL